ncbi:hypothetical protein [Rhodovulum euryhalinum]|uniref:Glycosyl transferase family 25 n=1 Tax=Rhodovulum euryhalinum TaxID=35805 RepID=A0A4R2KKX4_9RHOB|nr:hypothetical protein [Rhodovulum euryhalinum]TCO74004.1 hypothetical protein EV655_101160 [Rhodovulum euryhalinum]
MAEAGETLFLVRTQGFGPMARLLAERLAATGVPVVAVVDERGGTADTAPFDKIVLDEARLAGMGLAPLPANWGWLCGDLCYYLASQDRPGFARYALVESDVFLPEAGAAPLVTALAKHPAPAIAAQLGASDRRRRYSRGLARFGLDPAWGCIFPLSRVSDAVVAAMRAFRSEQLRTAPGERLNDEAILAGAVQRHGFSWARLEDVVPDQVPPLTFDTNPPHLLETVAADPAERRLFHPVVPFETVLGRVRSGEKAYSRHRLRRVLRTVSGPMHDALLAALDAAEATP